MYYINSETSKNFSKGCVNITSAVSASQYYWLPFFMFDIVCVSWMYQL